MVLGLTHRTFKLSQHCLTVVLVGMLFISSQIHASTISRLTIPDGKMIEADQVPQRALRGYGTVSAAGANWQVAGDTVSVVTFTCESDDKAGILASKYIVDIQNYGAVKPVSLKGVKGRSFEVRHGGTWLIAVASKQVHVLSASKATVLINTVNSLDTHNWQSPKEQAYPPYLDCFDNGGLGIWWMPTTKPADQMKWFTEFPAVGNLHHQGQTMIPAPGVYDTTGGDNAIAQMDEAGKTYRHMLWSGSPTGNNPWFDALELPGHHSEKFPDGHPGGRRLFEAGGYNTNQVVSPIVRTIEDDALIHIMANRVDDPKILGWMEPHGEFHQTDPDSLPPGYRTRYPAYLQLVKQYSLASLSEAHTGHRDAYQQWSDVPVSDTAFFYGRRQQVLDLDDQPWKWDNTDDEQGLKAGYNKPDFDDAKWSENYRDEKVLLAYVKRTGGKVPLWFRFNKDVPADFLKRTAGQKRYLHIMPYTMREGKWVSVWLNGKQIADKIASSSYYTKHVQVDVTDQLKAGDNHFAIYSNGGRIAYRVFISNVKGQDFPFEDAHLNQQFLDWRDYLVWEKVQTLTHTLQVMRSVDPVRPIKLMTPHFMQGEALDLMERYGAYPQLTGEGSFYRPMHYKGYSLLRRLPTSSEPGGPSNTPNKAQHLFGMIFAESQDAHDYVFDFTRDFWRYPEVVAWWKKNQYLLRTLGKTDLLDPTFGLLRDTRQDSRYDDGTHWSWDLSRGSLPSLGMTPVLVDGMELERGLADKLDVIMDSATTVMDEPIVDAVTRYVTDGGTFVAMFQTGQHEPTKRWTYPLAHAFGLTVKPTLITEENYHKWPLGKLKFTQEQNLIPSLKGKTCEGSGVSIDYMDVLRTGAIQIHKAGSDATPIAYWEDGSMAIVQVKRGSGRFILVGTPFAYRFRDVQGQWLNDKVRQGYLKEMLASLGVKPQTQSSDPRVWFERRESKNGLYDVYFANALGIRDKNWKVDDRIDVQLAMQLRGDTHVIEPSVQGAPDVSAMVVDGQIDLGTQGIAPYGIRQFAVVRPNVGLAAPLHWLNVQWGHWRALEPVSSSLAQQVAIEAKAIAQSLGEAGKDITRDWKVRIDPKNPDDAQWVNAQPASADWINGATGTWRANGWTDATCVQYRKRIDVPADWLDGQSSIYLGLSGTWSIGLRGKGKLWVNGKVLDDSLARHFLFDVTNLIQNNQLDLAMQVQADGLTRGPGGSMYLRKSPAAVESLTVNDGWVAMTDWGKTSESVSIPINGPRHFGLQCNVMIPSAWAGKAVRLVIEPAEGRNSSEVNGVFIGRDGYIRNSQWHPIGFRVDGHLKPGQLNKLIFVGNGHHVWEKYKGYTPRIKSIRLERMQ